MESVNKAIKFVFFGEKITENFSHTRYFVEKAILKSVSDVTLGFLIDIFEFSTFID